MGVCGELDVEQRDVVAAVVVLAGGDQLVTLVLPGDGLHLDWFADDGSRTWEGRVVLEGCLERGELLVLSWQSTVISSIMLSRSRSARRVVLIDSGPRGQGWSGGWVQAIEQQRRAAVDLAALEPSDRLVHADGRGVLIELDDGPFDAT